MAGAGPGHRQAGSGWRVPLRRERLRWAVRIRGAVIASFLAVAALAHASGLVPALAPVLLAALAGAAMNGVAAACVRRWRGIGAMIVWSGAADAILITIVVRQTGGTRSPFLFLYVVQVVTAALVVGARLAALAAGVGVALLAAAMAGVESFPPGVAALESERMVWLLALAVTLGLLGFIGGHLTRRLARRERELAESQIVAVEKIRAFEVLIAGVAHELGNPLAVLAGNVEPIEQMVAAYEEALRSAAGGPGDAFPPDATAASDAPGASAATALDAWRLEAPALLANYREATERATALLAKLRALGRPTRGAELRLAPIRPGLESTLALVRHRLPAGVRLAVRYDDVPDVPCDPSELNQVFMNLLLNAADALRPGGTLWVALRRQGPGVAVVIRDDGPGIAPAILPHVFEPFFTTKDGDQGSGLGLAISRAIVARHGGTLEARTPAGGGAELVVTVPLAGLAPEVGRRADVEPVAEALAEEIEGENGHHDRGTGDDGEVRRDQEEGAAVVQHRPP
jgi:signal transduction histidine kinase